jgi:hypothetical protein
MKNILLFALVMIIMTACKQGSVKMVALDLLKYGVPVTIQAPENAKVTQPYGEGEVWIQDEASNFDIQVTKMITLGNDAAKVKAEQLEATKRVEGFSKLIMEEKSGFIFEENIDVLNYDFKYIVVQGDKQYVFQKGFTRIATLEEVEIMYNAVKQD